MKRLLVAFLALFSFSAQAQIVPSIPYNLTNGSLADATQVMGNFNTIVTDVNANGATSGANTNITSLTGLTTPLSNTYGGTVIYTGGTTGGSGNAQTLTVVTPTNFALTAGNIVTGVAGFSNNGATTLNVNSQGVTAVKKESPSGLTALIGGEIVTGQGYLFYYDGTQFELLNSASGITNSQLATMASNTVKANITAISATPSDVTFTSAFDVVFSSVQGDLLYRNSSIWGVLAPGSLGQTLVTGGASANPSWTGDNKYNHAAQNPSGTSNTSGLMMGLAGTITPVGSGDILVNVSGGYMVNAGGTECTVAARIGTGTAPSNGGALAGSVVGPPMRGTNVAFNSSSIVTGQTLNTALWIDVSAAASAGGGTCTITNVYVSAYELK